jgi:VanZ family protein
MSLPPEMRTVTTKLLRQEDPNNVRKIASIAFWFLAAIIIALSLVPPQLRPVSGAPHDIEHFAIFFVTGVAFGVGYGHKLFWALSAQLIFAGIIEVAQISVPGRHARLSDFVVDALASCGGVLLAYYSGRTRWKDRPN